MVLPSILRYTLFFLILFAFASARSIAQNSLSFNTRDGGWYQVEELSMTNDVSRTVQISDIDNDGTEDFVLMDGGLKAVSGTDGNIIWSSTGLGTITRFECFNDINGDGRKDVVVQSGQYGGYGSYLGQVSILDVTNGAPLIVSMSTFSADAFTRIGDVDSDGVEDLLLYQDNGVYWDEFRIDGIGIGVYSSIDGLAIWEDTTARYCSIGVELDSNLDGINDILLGDRAYSGNGYSNNGKISILDGADGVVLSTIEGTYTDNKLGELVSVLPDLNSDGVKDIVSVSVFDNASTSHTVQTDAFSTATLATIWSTSWGTTHYMYDITSSRDGMRAELMGDYDSDGKEELGLFLGATDTSGWYSSEDNSVCYLVNTTDGAVISVSETIRAETREINVINDISNDGVSEIAWRTEVDNGNGSDSFIGVTDVVNRINGWEKQLASHSLGTLFFDFNQDGIEDIMTCDEDQIRVFNSINGEVLGGFPSLPSGAATFADAGDEIIVSVNAAWQSNTSRITKIEKEFNEGMTSPYSSISRSATTIIDFDLDFNDSAAYYQYLFLACRTSGTVNPPELYVPLGYDIWLVKSYLGMLPGVFSNTSGILDDQGKATVTLTLPANSLPASFVGTSMYFAAVAKVVWSPTWEMSSVSNAITITP